MTLVTPPPVLLDTTADDAVAAISGFSLPRYRFPDASSDSRTVFDLVRDEPYRDGNSRQDLATFCTTHADDELRRLMDMSVDNDTVHKDEYP